MRHLRNACCRKKLARTPHHHKGHTQQKRGVSVRESAREAYPADTYLRVRRSPIPTRQGLGASRRVPFAMPATMLAVLPVALGAAAGGSPQKVGFSVSPQGEDVLDNGLVRLVFSRETGQFEAYGLQAEVMRLFEAGPA